tara:strand:- start:1259 stop:1519 length:261 start_codon:yes stop_codon:yes gene_type:complete
LESKEKGKIFSDTFLERNVIGHKSCLNPSALAIAQKLSHLAISRLSRIEHVLGALVVFASHLDNILGHFQQLKPIDDFVGGLPTSF